MITPVGTGTVWRATHLACPDDQRLIEQAALLKIGDQCGNRLVGDPGILRVSQF